MFQINPDQKVRSVTLSVNPQEKVEFNELFARFQELQGGKTYFKDLISSVFHRAINSIPENEVQQLRDQVEELNSALMNRPDCVCTPEEYQSKLDRIAELESQVSDLQTQLNESENIEIEIPNSEEIIEEFKKNNIVIDLNADQIQLLDIIIQNRIKKNCKPELLTRKDLILGLALNRASLENWHGEFYTGL